MNISVPDVVKKLANLLNEEKFFMVGGIVRDSILGKTTDDIDVCSGLTPNEIVNRLHEKGITAKIQSEKMGTVKIFLDENEIEHTTFRTDVYAENGTHEPIEVNFVNELSVDAFRRDFTINALYADGKTGEVKDFFGGLGDISSKIIRTIASAEKTFCDDPLRILRLARFSASLGFQICDDTFVGAKISAYRLEKISRTRIWAEATKTLKYGTVAFVRYSELLSVMGATQQIFGVCPKFDLKDVQKEFVLASYMFFIAKARQNAGLSIGEKNFEAFPDKVARKIIPSILEFIKTRDEFVFFDKCDKFQTQAVSLMRAVKNCDAQKLEMKWNNLTKNNLWVDKNHLAINGNHIKENYPCVEKQKYAIILMNLRRAVFENATQNTEECLLQEMKKYV